MIASIVSELRIERDRIDRAIAALEGISTDGRRRGRSRGRRRMSAAARARIAAAQRARWAKQKRTSGLSAASTKKPRPGGMSAAGRKRMSEMMKRRWAERRKQQQP